MKSIFRYIALITLYALLAHTSLLLGQTKVIPKVGWTIPSLAPTLDTYEYDSKNGILAGIELRNKGQNIYFNPGVYFLYNKIDINQLTSGGSAHKLRLHRTESLWMKVNMGMAVNLFKTEGANRIHFRNGISGGVLLKRPDFKSISALSDNYRKLFIEYHAGMGVDLNQVIINMDYHISLVRRIGNADFVENTFSFNFGYLLQRQ